MNQLSVITPSRRVPQSRLCGYDMPAREFKSGAEVLSSSMAVRERLMPKPAPVAVSRPSEKVPATEPYVPTPPRRREPHDFLFIKAGVRGLGTPKRGNIAGRKWRPLEHMGILKETAEDFNISLGELQGSRRSQVFVQARNHAFYRLNNELCYSLPMIGKLFGGRNHTTVMHGLRRYEASLRGEVYIKPNRLRDKAAREAAQP